LRSPLVYSVVIIGLFGSIALVTQEFIGIMEKLYKTIIYLIWIFFATKVLILILDTFRETDTKTRILSKKVLPFFEKIIKVVITIISFFVILKIWGTDIMPLLTSAGIAGVVLAFAAKESIANVLSGIAIYLDKTYELGDLVQTPDGERGKVVDVTLRTTKIQNRSNILVTIPNSVMANAKVINETSLKGPTRFAIPFSVVYGTKVEKVEKTLENLKLPSMISKSPKPYVRFRNFGSSGLEFEYLFFLLDPLFRGRAKDILIRKIYEVLNKSKIKFAFPHQQIVFDNELKVSLKKS
jgi:small-conductance mechanosensitive channel